MSDVGQRIGTRSTLEDFAVDLEEIEGLVGVGDEYEVKAGLQTGENYSWAWHSLYRYCQPLDGNNDDDEEEEESGWAWRIVFHWSDAVDEPAPVFDSIVEFLDWCAR
jgi:hypothetical protein